MILCDIMLKYFKKCDRAELDTSFFIGKSIRTLKSDRILKTDFIRGHASMRTFNEFKWNRSFKKIYLNTKKEANPHILIVGSSGYGKSTLVKSLVIEINNNKIPIILFDGHNEHSDVLKLIGGNLYNLAYTPFNLFALNGLLPDEKINSLIELFNRIYTFGALQENMIRKVLSYMYRKFGQFSDNENQPDIRSFISELLIFKKNAMNLGEKNRIDSILQRFYALSRIIPDTGAINSQEIFNKNCVFQLSTIKNNDLRIMYIDSIIEFLYRHMKNNGINRGISKYIIIDESKALIDRAGSVLSHFFIEARKFGYGMILVSNTPMLPNGIVSNTSTIISFGLREPTEISYISNIIGSGVQEKSNIIKATIGDLKKNTIIISSYNINPAIVKTPSYSNLHIIADQIEERLEEKTPLIKKLSKKIVSLNWIIKNTDLNSIELEKLKKSNILRFEYTSNPQKTYVINNKTNLSMEHELCIKRISEVLLNNGIENRITNGKGPDIIAYYNGSICIEYETGRKNINETIKMLNSRKYKNIIVVVNDLKYNSYKIIDIPNIKIIKYSDIGSLPTFIKSLIAPNHSI